MASITSVLAMSVAALVLLAAPLTAEAQATQIMIAQPAEATTMDPGRSTQVLTVNYFYNLYDTLLLGHRAQAPARARDVVEEASTRPRGSSRSGRA